MPSLEGKDMVTANNPMGEEAGVGWGFVKKKLTPRLKTISRTAMSKKELQKKKNFFFG